jgi:hypothetical protein
LDLRVLRAGMRWQSFEWILVSVARDSNCGQPMRTETPRNSTA